MKPIAVLYATREGQTRKIAEHIGAALRLHGLVADVLDVRDSTDGILDNYSGCILAASVHLGKHEPEMIAFVKRHRPQLESMPSAFLSVTLSEAGAERPTASPEEHARFVADVQTVMEAFFNQTGWHPKRVKPVAGALLYSHYNLLVRFIMRRIAKTIGSDTDTSRDYEYTDWVALDKFIEEFTSELGCQAAPNRASRAPV